jgi:hypothetical protein
MKKFIYVLSTLFVVSLLGLSSCDEPVNPDDTDARASYTYTWTCTETGGMTYPVTISLDPSNSAQVLLANFHYFGANEKAAAIATTNNLTFPSQEVCANTITGGGTLNNNNKITLKYYVNNHSTIDTINAIYTK